jgi:hypothetical protein
MQLLQRRNTLGSQSGQLLGCLDALFRRLILGVPLSTATHTIDRLVGKGLVIRVRSEQDRRVVQVEMSEVGKAFQTALRARHQAMARSWLTPLSPAERETFLNLMAKITQGAKPEPAAQNGTAAGTRRVSPGALTR